MSDAVELEAHASHKAACQYAETSSDPLAAMLRDAHERLFRDPPDVSGARVSLHGAMLGNAVLALRAKPEGEPVAWQYRTQRSDGQWSAWVVTSEDPSKDGWAGGYEAIPLYAHPTAWPDREAVARAIWAAYARTQPGLSGGPDRWAENAADAILALPQAERPGFKLVPVEPTEAMLNAAVDVDPFKLGDISPLGIRYSPQELFSRAYRAMLAAAGRPSND